MPYGLNIATCLHCGRQWTVGDCIPSVCPECDEAGHRGLPGFPITGSLLDGGCPECDRQRREIMVRAGEARQRRRERDERRDTTVLFDSHPEN
jgi:hypothetical protein